MSDRLEANLTLLGDALPAALATRLRHHRPKACRHVPARDGKGPNVLKDGALLFDPDATVHAQRQVEGYLANPVRHFSRLTHVTDRPVLHADLYRLGDPREVDELGLLDNPAAIVLVEWAERAPEIAAAATLVVALAIPPGGAGRSVTVTVRQA